MRVDSEVTRTPADTLNDLRELVNACDTIQSQSWDLIQLLCNIRDNFNKATPVYKEGSTKTKDIIGYNIFMDVKKYMNIKNKETWELVSLDSGR